MRSIVFLGQPWCTTTALEVTKHTHLVFHVLIYTTRPGKRKVMPDRPLGTWTSCGSQPMLSHHSKYSIAWFLFKRGRQLCSLHTSLGEKDKTIRTRNTQSTNEDYPHCRLEYSFVVARRGSTLPILTISRLHQLFPRKAPPSIGQSIQIASALLFFRC